LNLFQYRSLQFTHFNFGTLWRRHRFFSSQDTKLKHQLNFEPLGRYLEWVLQEFNQNLQTQIKYKIDNQYTLSELFEPFKSRIKEKLKSQHDLFLKLELFEQNTIFRNFCAHYKNTETEFSTSELCGIVDKWEEIELMMICSACNELVKYDSSDKTISCRCKKLNLAPPKP